MFDNSSTPYVNNLTYLEVRSYHVVAFSTALLDLNLQSAVEWACSANLQILVELQGAPGSQALYRTNYLFTAS
jgi:hypothetical protein